MVRYRLVVLLGCLVLASVRPAIAATIVVGTTTDELNTDGDCSLREALQAANTNAAVDDCPAGSDTATDEIMVPAGTYTLSGAAGEDFGESGDLDVLANTAALDLIVTGAGSSATIIQACTTSQKVAPCPVGQGTPDRVFSVLGASVTFRDLTIRNGGGPVGGGMYVTVATGITTLDHCILADNGAAGDGGGIFSFFEVAILDSVVRGNRSGALGGGIHSQGTLDVRRSTFTDNYAVSAGGGIAVFAGTAEILNSTISGNTTGNVGGGISNNGSLTIASCTITDNTASLTFDGRGGGLLLSGPASIVRNSIVAGNTDQRATDKSPDCYAPGGVTSEGYNVVGIGNTCFGFDGTKGDQVGTAVAPLDAQLGPLTDNGGATPTHEPAPDSPATGGGNPALPGSQPPACPATDQRGIARPQGNVCDSGAVETTDVPQALGLDAIRPSLGGNAGEVSAVLSGTAFVDGATARLTRTGSADIVGLVPKAFGTGALLATFDLTGAAAGTWDVVITNPDATTATLANGFTVEAGGAPVLWAEPLVPRRFRQNRLTTVMLAYGNRGTVNAYGVPLWLSFPDDFTSALRFVVAPPPTHAGQPATDWTHVGITTRATDGPGRRAIPLMLTVVPAGFRGVLVLRLRPPATHPTGPFRLAFNLGTPFFRPALSPDVTARIVTEAKQRATTVLDATTLPSDAVLTDYVDDQLGTIRAAATTNLRDDVGDPRLHSMTHLLIDASQFAAAAGGQSFATASATPDPIVGPLAALRRWLAGAFLAPAQARSLDADCWSPPFYGECPEPDCRGFPEVGPCEPEDYPPCDQAAPFAPCNPGPGTGGPGPVTPDPDVVGSFDPNDKIGPQGAQRIVTGDAVLPYAVFFENLETATAPAQEVVITDQLDVATLDLATFALGAIGFGDTLVVPPAGLQTYTTEVDLRPAQNLLVRIEAGLDAATGLVTWRFTSLDPATGELPEDPDAGFLPPNVTSPEGTGSVVFTIAPKAALPLGTEICNDARIVFDTNAPIDTPEWCNTIGIPPRPEDCENCADDDGDGKVDRADEDCPAPADGGGAGVAPAAVKPLATCAKALRKVGTKLVKARVSLVEKCLKAAADCVQLKPGDAACAAKATTTCAKAFASANAGAAALLATLTEQCGPAAAALGPASGLGFDADVDACAARGVPGADSLAEIVDCVGRRYVCAADRAIAAAVPRAAELLSFAGRAPASELPCLATATPGNGNAAPALRKALRKCDAAAQKAGAKLLAARTATRQSCAAAVFACAQEKPGIAACNAKAQKTCAAGLAKNAAADAALVAAVAKACGAAPLTMANLLSADGLAASARGLPCAGLGVATLATPTDLATCLARETACRADQLAATTSPRLRELLTLGGVAP